MYDRPHADELLEASRLHIEQNILPLAKAHNFKLYFQTLVAVNVLRIVERELTSYDVHLRETWARLTTLMGDNAPPPTTQTALKNSVRDYNQRLCEQIRAGERDQDKILFDHLLHHSIAQLSVANPKFLTSLTAEDSD